MPLPPIASRPARDLDDLVVAGDISTAAWVGGARHVEGCAGDIDWWFANAWPADLGEVLSLWSHGDSTVGWSWDRPDELEFHVWSGNERADDAVREAIIDARIAQAAASGEAFVAWAVEDDRHAVDRLASRGFVATERRLSQFQLDPRHANPTDAPPPDRYVVRLVRLPAELEARVAVHRAAFAPSRMTSEKYRRLIGLPHYRLARDWVAEAPDGSLAAFAIAWWDPVANVGELEPVGTDPRHQRRGLARSVLLTAIADLAACGARVVQVYSDAANIASEALYTAVGFRRHAYHRAFRWSPPR